MYIYHFWPLCMHCQKTTTIRCFLETTYDLLVVLRKPWICTLCFDAHFSKFRDFWWFWTIFNRKMDILDHFWGPQTASYPKVTIYLPLSPWTSQNLLKTLSKPLILTILDPFWGPQTVSCPKVTIYLPLTPRTLSGPAQNPVILT